MSGEKREPLIHSEKNTKGKETADKQQLFEGEIP